MFQWTEKVYQSSISKGIKSNKHNASIIAKGMKPASYLCCPRTPSAGVTIHSSVKGVKKDIPSE